LKTKDISEAVIGWREANAQFENRTQGIGEASAGDLSHEVIQKANTILKSRQIHPLQAPTISANSTSEEIAQFKDFSEVYKWQVEEFIDELADEQMDDAQRQKDYDEGRWGQAGYKEPYKPLDPRSPKAVALRIMDGELNVALDPNITDLLEVYLSKNLKRKVRNPAGEAKFEKATRSIFKALANELPNGMDTEVDTLDRSFFEEFLERHWPNASTRKKSLSYYVSAINTYNRENSAAPLVLNLAGLVTNAQVQRDATESRSFTPEEFDLFVSNVRSIAKPDTRLIGLLVAYTGTPNTEVAGLMWQEVKLDDTVPHMIIRNNKERVMGKNRQSRTIPLVEPLLSEFVDYSNDHRGGKLVFPNWQGRVNDLSKPLNECVVDLLPDHEDRLVAYSSRHTFKDRADAVAMPSGISSYLMGHRNKASSRVHEGYGTGRPVTQLVEWMEKVMTCEEWGYFG